MGFKVNKYYHSFTAGRYPQVVNGELIFVTVSPSMLKKMRDAYDTDFREAPLWIGHPGSAPALGWVRDMTLEGDKLFVAYSYLNPKGAKLVNEKEYKYPSLEIVTEVIDGIKTPYLHAVGLTNVPLVDSLEDLSAEKLASYKDSIFLSGESFYDSKPMASVVGDPVMEDAVERGPVYSFSQSNNRNKMNGLIIKFAERLGISITALNLDTEEDVLEYVESECKKLKKKYANDSNTVTNLSIWVSKAVESFEQKAQLEEEIKTLKSDKVDDLLTVAQTEGKVLPKEVEGLKLIGLQKFETLKDMIEERQPDKKFEQNKTGQSSSASVSVPVAGDKFEKADGTEKTFEEVLDEIADNPALADKYSDEELDELREKNSKYFSKIEGGFVLGKK